MASVSSKSDFREPLSLRLTIVSGVAAFGLGIPHGLMESTKDSAEV